MPITSGFPGALPTSMALFIGRNIDFQSTADQLLQKRFSGTRCFVTSIWAICNTGAVVTSSLGGIYTGASKSGLALVAAANSWAGLSTPDRVIQATLVVPAGYGVHSVSQLYLSLTTGSTGACTGDILVLGLPLDL